ncbi:hypothetical protein [Streptomyces collinus]|uniref:Uncharacterized protein n=1 Tax=Streptomyces collinus TaxID=42684 RepID=A0AA89Q1D3_STRCU|nr:hypothetical protein [Streptomyces collinus]MBB5812612.1 hypothetical protein [Streptomyces collinus]WMX65751.1 hypothetical protein RFN52_21345 [Streptomyces collinus]
MTFGRRVLEHGLVDVIDLHTAPVLLGDKIRLSEQPRGAPVPLDLLTGQDRRAGPGRPAVTGRRPSTDHHEALSSTGN